MELLEREEIEPFVQLFPERLKNLKRVLTSDSYAIGVHQGKVKDKVYWRISIIRFDQAPIISFDDKQEIKNALFPNGTAIEIFPPQDELIDEGNVAHLWVLPFGMKLPFKF